MTAEATGAEARSGGRDGAISAQVGGRAGRVLCVVVAPSGRVRVEAAGGAGGEGGIAAEVADRVEGAFARGAAPGVLHLGLVEMEAELPADLSFLRDLGRLFVTRVCAQPDLEERREVRVACAREEIASLAEAAPPVTGAEYLSAAGLEALWAEMERALGEDIAAAGGSVQEYLRAQHPSWNLVGRVCFHLAENKQDPDRPFAFLATYTTRLGETGQARHRPLGPAVREASRRGDREALLALLAPVERAAAACAWVKELSDSGDLFGPLSWTPKEAHRFLLDVDRLGAAGVLVRAPDWWSRRPGRVEVRVTVGGKEPSLLGAGALLDFSVELTVGGERVSEQELQEALRRSEGLALVRGRWVEVDGERVRAALSRWQEAQRAMAREGVSFAEAMRLVAGADIGGGEGPAPSQGQETRRFSRVVAGEWLASVLKGLRGPDGLAAADPGPALRATLRPYQRTGAAWLWTHGQLGLGACLADDMGLGKTVQVLALFCRLRETGQAGGPHLLVVPASLIANWQVEIHRFAPSLRALIAHPSAMPRDEIETLPRERLREADVVITSYGTTRRLAWLAGVPWDALVLDEAQAIKNPGARQTRAVKALRARRRIALTGTPVENRLSDLWSIFDFLNPGLLGSAAEFGRFAKRLAAGGSEGYAPLRALVRPYVLRRLKSDPRVIADLPDKTEVKAFCALTREQIALYRQAVEELARELQGLSGMKRRGAILAFLLRFKQICNHPAHWLRDGDWAAGRSGKLARLGEIAEAIAVRQDKALVFTQFREVTDPLAAFLAGVFGRDGLVLHGQTPVARRRELVDRFQEDERVPFFVLSLKAGGTGLNLTAASHVIHFDRWWNPAVEDQATDRAYRIGQHRNVLVHKLVCRGTVEERIDALIESKKALAADLIEGGGEALVTEMDDRALLDLFSLDLRRALDEG